MIASVSSLLAVQQGALADLAQPMNLYTKRRDDAPIWTGPTEQQGAI
jgi:hypothetical protein